VAWNKNSDSLLAATSAGGQLIVFSTDKDSNANGDNGEDDDNMSKHRSMFNSVGSMRSPGGGSSSGALNNKDRYIYVSVAHSYDLG
jgi:hypothetical protein